MKKRIFTALLAVILVVTMAVPAMAALPTAPPFTQADLPAEWTIGAWSDWVHGWYDDSQGNIREGLSRWAMIATNIPTSQSFNDSADATRLLNSIRPRGVFLDGVGGMSVWGAQIRQPARYAHLTPGGAATPAAPVAPAVSAAPAAPAASAAPASVTAPVAPTADAVSSSSSF